MNYGRIVDFADPELDSIPLSDHFMLWGDGLPIALRDRPFWTKWLDWADQNLEYLHVGRTLFREPWGNRIVASLPPNLEGRLPASSAQLHGSAHCIGDRGCVFLFHPSAGARAGVIPIRGAVRQEYASTLYLPFAAVEC